MDRYLKKIELVANVCIIIVALLVCFVFVKNYFFARVSKTEPVHTGMKLSLPDVVWAKSDKTLLFVLQKGCHFCSESAPFYKKLIEDFSGRADLRFIAVFPQDVAEGRKYLNDLGIVISEIKQVSYDTLGIQGTPTLLLINKAGVVTDAWMGKLTTNQEAEVRDRLQSNSMADIKSADIDALELKRMMDAKKPVTILDVRDRADYAYSHIPEAVNIPADEVEVRASNELSPSNLIVTYCQCEGDEVAKFAGEMIQREAFSKVRVLRGGLDSWEHAGLPIDSQGRTPSH